MKILITAFEPFGGEKVNPSEEVLKLLGDKIGDAGIIKLVLPTAFNRSSDNVIEKIKETMPDLVICLGQAGGRTEITPERVAVNIDDARIPDNEGYQAVDETILKDGETAYFSTLPVKAMVQAIKEENLPASLSNTAGTFVCNHVMYRVLHHIKVNKLGIRAGFIHIPYAHGQVKEEERGVKFSLSIEDMVRGITAAVKAAMANDADLPLQLGKTE